MPLLFALTMFVSATLLFMIQPMIGKMTAPLLGGTPAVWNTCMVFFQALLLGGYYYSHKVTSLYEPRRQTAIHALVLIVPAAVMLLAVLLSDSHLPIPILPSLSPQGSDYPFFGVIVMLTVAIGMPFFVISTSAPLLQRWFNYTGHPSARDPYFLYGASNFGSLLSLVAYPIYIESTLTVAEQTQVFAGGYLVLAVMAFLCGRAVRNAPPPKPLPKADRKVAEVAEVPPTRLQKLRWLGLAFVPSSLMLGVTTFISTDIASLPLLWIIPLALYLLTFIIAFANTRWPAVVLLCVIAVLMVWIATIYLPTPEEAKAGASAQWSNIAMTLALGVGAFAVIVASMKNGRELFDQALILTTPLLVMVVVFMQISNSLIAPGHLVTIGVSLLAFFVVTLLCHTELNRTRPATKYLTNFYLTMSFGGMLGGMLNSLIAPIVFTFVSEYPLTLIVACMLFPTLTPPKPPGDVRVARLWDAIVALLLFSLSLGLMQLTSSLVDFFKGQDSELLQRLQKTLPALLVFGFPVMLAYLFIERPLRFGLSVGAILFASFFHFYRGESSSAEYYGRSYFGTLKIESSKIGYGIQSSQYVENQFHSTKDVIDDKGKPIPDDDGTNIRRSRREQRYLRLVHGTTLHGKQLEFAEFWGIVGALAPLSSPHPLSVGAMMMAGSWESWQYTGRDPLTYYHRTGPVGSMFNGFAARNRRQVDAGIVPNTDVACIGLGTGTLSSYGLPGQKMVFFEIDTHVRKLVEPDVEYVRAHRKRNAREGELVQPYYFTYIDSAKRQGVDIEFSMGDARVRLEQMKDRKFGMMLIDAFSSDAIPIHLLTKEAVELYFDRMDEEGILALHISNRYLNLEPVAQRIAEKLGVSALTFHDGDDDAVGKSASTWLCLARKPQYLADIRAQTNVTLESVEGKVVPKYKAKWADLEEDPKVKLWTDDYSPIRSVLKWKFKFFD